MKLGEKGMVIPLMLGISLMMASLLMMLALRLESQAHSYELRRTFLQLTLLEKESVFLIVEMLQADPDHLSSAITLSNGTLVTLTIHTEADLLKVNYRFRYRGYLRQGVIVYDLTNEERGANAPLFYFCPTNSSRTRSPMNGDN